MATLTTKHSVDTIDEKLRENGFTVTRDQYTDSDYTLRKETATSWDFENKFYSKKDLVDFANTLN